MTNKEAIEALAHVSISPHNDKEIAHLKADMILLDLMSSLPGGKDVVAAYKKVDQIVAGHFGYS